MCGITGIYAFTDKGKTFFSQLNNSVATLKQRGPDANGIFTHNKVALGHTRLSIIDTSNAGAQPFTDASGRYTIVFNGEFFNYKEHRKSLLEKGIKLKSESDTEVLLHLYIAEGARCLEKVNGFFAFAIYDNREEKLFVARDRMGVKPLLIYQDEDKFIFGSEMKTLLAYGISKEIDEVSLYTYLQLNYIPAPNSIFKTVKKLEAGNYLEIANCKLQITNYYQIPKPIINYQLSIINYQTAQKKLVELLDASVQRRMIADVPLGAFLSGGIDSSVITALAAQHTKHLNTFSIGFKDEPLFDETRYAQLVAKKYQTNHTIFSLSNNDLFACLHSVLDYIDEPFADSSALAVFILSQHTRKFVTVALSGDGADELFAGYNKHRAEYQARSGGIAANLVKLLKPVWDVLPKSRNSKFGNKIRQLQKFSEGMNLNEKERYWRWAGLMNERDAENLLDLTGFKNLSGLHDEYSKRKKEILKYLNSLPFGEGQGGVLYTDMHLVLQNDMLVKVDMMSMANSLEVRTPFLDWTVVDFAFSLPSEYKIDEKMKKKIVQDAFRNYLPEELYNRHKQGFEVPLLKWFQTELKSMITDDLLNDNFIKQQNIFSVESVKNLKAKLFSNNPNDAVATVWALIVFQYWWKKQLGN